MKFKKIMLVAFLLLAVLTVGAVSASEDIVSDDNLAVEDAPEDIIEESSVEEVITSDSDEEVVGVVADDFKVNVSEEVNLDDENAKIVEFYYPEGATGSVELILTSYDDFDYTTIIFSEYEVGDIINITTSSFDGLDPVKYNVELTYQPNDGADLTLKQTTIQFTKTLTKDDFTIVKYTSLFDSTDYVVNVWNYPATGVLFVYVNGEKRYNSTIADTDDDVYVRANQLKINSDGEYAILVKFKTDWGDEIELAKFNTTTNFNFWEDDDDHASINDVDVEYGDDFKGYNVVDFYSDNSEVTGLLKVFVGDSLKFSKQISASDYEYGSYSINVEAQNLDITKEGTYNIKVMLDDEILAQKTCTVSVSPKIDYPDTMAVGENEVLTVTAQAGKNGNAKLYENDDYGESSTFIGEFPIVNGYGSYSLSKLSKGDHGLRLALTFGSTTTYEYLNVYVGENTQGFKSSVTPASLTVGGNVNVVVTGPKTDANLYIYVDGKQIKSVNFINGQVNEVLSGLTVGSHRIKVLLDGENFYSNTVAVTVNPVPVKKDTTKLTVKKDTIKLTLKKVAVKKSAKKLILQATLKINGKAVKGKVIKFKFNKKTIKAKTNKKGVAKVTVKKAVLKKLKVGKKLTYTATYSKTTKKVTVKVKK
ncbi:hypothetical protein [Methanobrevibacter sp.]